MTLRELLALVAPSKREDPQPGDREASPHGGRRPSTGGVHGREQLLAEALHDGEGNEAPLLVRLFSAIGTWIGAAMVATIFAALEIYEVVPVALLLAIGLFAVAISLSRRPARSLALTQLIWAMALGGHGLLAGVAAEIGVDEGPIAVTWTLLNLVLLVMIRVPSFAIASGVCTVGFATWLAYVLELPMYPLWVALPAAAVATAAWLAESRFAVPLGRSWVGLAYGLPIGVACSLSLFGIEGIATGIGAIIAILLALLWVWLAHERKSIALQTIASIQLAGFLFFFYYQLETSLLLKSVLVMSSGAALLLGAWLARPQPLADHAEPKARPRMLPALALIVLTLGLVIGPSIQKERILASGQTVLLPLAPLDPRSLMQGDYVQLRYRLEAGFERVYGQRLYELHDRGDIPRHGKLVITLDEENVGHFVRIDDGTPLAAGEQLLEYRLRGNWGESLRVGADSFLFEEGRAGHYERARFGELVVSEDGEAILVGLRDADKQPLGR
jgi:uncharacterized membrane-anchored protein